MLRILMPILQAILTSADAQAEDFSGFYAGINAGYAEGRERDRTVSASVPGDPNAAGPGRGVSDLPPSALGAAASMRGVGTIGRRGSAVR